MITDTMLREAAAKSCADFVDFLEQDFDPEHQHVFSNQFEQKIKKLKRKADHPTFYQVRRLVASFLLILLIGGGIWLTTDVEARAAVWGWVKGIYETYFVFSYDEGPATTEEPVAFRPTWLPEGYSEALVDDSDAYVYVVYTNAQGNLLTIGYVNNPTEEIDWFIDISQVKLKQSTINGNPAEIFITEDPEVASGIAWTFENTAFYINGFLSESDLIAVAESVENISPQN